MTTIACDGKSIAGDGMINSNGTIHDQNCVKVFRLKSGGIVGFSGQPYFHSVALAYINGDADSLEVGDEFEAVILYPDGRCECMDSKGRRYPQSIPTATGSGAPFALAAMDAGLSAEDAVYVASRRDCYTGHIVTTLGLVQ